MYWAFPLVGLGVSTSFPSLLSPVSMAESQPLPPGPPQPAQRQALGALPHELSEQHLYTHAKSLQLCLTLCDPMDSSPPDFSAHWGSPGKNTGVGCHFLLQGIFLTQGSNLGLLHCRQIPY